MSADSGSAISGDCVSTPGQLLTNTSDLHSTVDVDDELLRYIWKEYLHPKQYEWVLIVAYIIVFLVSLIGNSLGKFLFPLLFMSSEKKQMANEHVR